MEILVNYIYYNDSAFFNFLKVVHLLFSSGFPFSYLSHSSHPLNTIFLHSLGSTLPFSQLSLSFLSLSFPCLSFLLSVFVQYSSWLSSPSFLVYPTILFSPWLPLPFLPLGSPYPSIPLDPLFCIYFGSPCSPSPLLSLHPSNSPLTNEDV